MSVIIYVFIYNGLCNLYNHCSCQFQEYDLNPDGKVNVIICGKVEFREQVKAMREELTSFRQDMERFMLTSQKNRFDGIIKKYLDEVKE